MDSSKTLSSLTHTSAPKISHTSHDSNSAEEEDAEIGTFSGDEGDPKAMMVIDKGDADSITALKDLQRRWTEKFGEEDESPPLLSRLPRMILPRTMVPLPMRQEPTTDASIVSVAAMSPTTSPIAATQFQPIAVTVAFAIVSHPDNLTAISPSLPDSPIPTSSPTGIFVGNVPLHPYSNIVNFDDKIANVFHNLMRKILSYVPPMRQNGEIIVRPSLDTFREKVTTIECDSGGLFLGKRPYYHHVKDYVTSIWPLVTEVIATANGFFFFSFKMVVAMEEVIKGCLWLFQGQPIVLQKWKSGMVLRKLKHMQVPWVKL
ncbi:UNVERIFIED_CONTAM: hypothetical protein Sindi_2853500 [Sesamum indicum]